MRILAELILIIMGLCFIVFIIAGTLYGCIAIKVELNEMLKKIEKKGCK